jgi:hypothetical protein
MSAAKKSNNVEKIIYAPVVSADSSSPEAILMRDAKELEAQAAIDTKYDAVVERFEVENTPISKSLLGLTILLGIVALYVRR